MTCAFVTEKNAGVRGAVSFIFMPPILISDVLIACVTLRVEVVRDISRLIERNTSISIALAVVRTYVLLFLVANVVRGTPAISFLVAVVREGGLPVAEATGKV